MNARLIAFASIAVAAIVVTAAAQQPYPPAGNYPPPADQNLRPMQPVGPDQPVQPQVPTLVPRGPQPGMQPNGQPGMQPGMTPGGQQAVEQQPPQPPPPPFVLTAQEQAQVEQILIAWERQNRLVKTFDSQFKRWVYDAVFGNPNQPAHVDVGVIKFAAPDKGMFRIDKTEKDGRDAPIEDARAEHWISDGKAIVHYDHVTKKMTIHKLPPEMQGKKIADGPLPFLFGSTAQDLKDRFFLRVVTPANVPGQIWLDAYPRRQQDAANFSRAQFIINTQDMSPNALKLIQPNRKDYIVYSFFDIVMNDPLRMFRGDPFRAVRPMGWQTVVEEPQTTQARRLPNEGRR
jgi:TIGR03009 family protein